MVHFGFVPAAHPDPVPETLSLDEMKRRYAGEWLLLDRIKLDEKCNMERARVLFHSRDKDEVHHHKLTYTQRDKVVNLVFLDSDLPVPERNRVAIRLLQDWASTESEHDYRVWPSIEQELIRMGAISDIQSK